MRRVRSAGGNTNFTCRIIWQVSQIMDGSLSSTHALRRSQGSSRQCSMTSGFIVNQSLHTHNWFSHHSHLRVHILLTDNNRLVSKRHPKWVTKYKGTYELVITQGWLGRVKPASMPGVQPLRVYIFIKYTPRLLTICCRWPKDSISATCYPSSQRSQRGPN